MKISELIEKLKTLDPNIEVFTKGYEGGYCDIEEDFEVQTFKKMFILNGGMDRMK